MQLGTHRFTTSKVKPIDNLGNPKSPPPGAPDVGFDPVTGLATLPDSVIYGFNGTFPGAMINVEYGKPAIIRFENDLDKNPLGLDRQNFGAPDFAFLTHLHNGHSAPESDGNPHYMQINEGGYTPGDWVDNLYLNYPAGGDPNEIQTFMWFHDHRMHHTGANVYKGMVGLMPSYDPGMPDPNNPGQILPGTGLDTGNESDPAPNLKLPGVRENHPDGSFDIKYDIHMALYDCVLDDGITPHSDLHTDVAACGATHPEWWGKQFFKHFPGKGFVGDVFTVNCKAYPVLNVFQRRYRFRFLGASVVRIYELALMTSAAGPVAMPGTQGQWQIPDGVQWKPWTYIANMGGLLPQAINTNSVHLWPASRHEFVVDFTNIPTGTEIYITNVLVMEDGLKPDFNDPRTPLADLLYKVPLVKIVVGGLPPETDQSAVIASGTPLRPMPKLANGNPVTLATTGALPHKDFRLEKGGPSVEETWVIALEPGVGLPFNPLLPLTTVVRDQPEVWTTSTGGGWAHPMHMHQEEHITLARVGGKLTAHPEDTGKADVANLEPGESVTFYRNFRTFEGRYVAHCHNLAHEDHNMMFGWSILPSALAGAISGRVTNRGIAPLPGVTMTLAGPTGMTRTTDADGNYSFTGLANGSYTVTPSLPGFRFIVPSRKVSLIGANVPRRNFIGV
jgi:FtsP/CotA-like multicopper oxidase with cupredoxin domain